MDGFTGFKAPPLEELPRRKGHGPLPRRAPGRATRMNAADAFSRTPPSARWAGPSTRPAGAARRSCHSPRVSGTILDLFSNDSVALGHLGVCGDIIDAAHPTRGKTLCNRSPQHRRLPPSPGSPPWAGHSNAEPGHPGLLRPSHTSNGPTESHQRTPRTPTRLRPRTAKPHPPHHFNSSEPEFKLTTPPIEAGKATRNQYIKGLVIDSNDGELCIGVPWG